MENGSPYNPMNLVVPRVRLWRGCWDKSMFGQRELVQKAGGAALAAGWTERNTRGTVLCGSAACRTLHTQAEQSTVFPNRTGCLPRREEPHWLVQQRRGSGQVCACVFSWVLLACVCSIDCQWTCSEAGCSPLFPPKEDIERTEESSTQFAFKIR